MMKYAGQVKLIHAHMLMRFVPDSVALGQKLYVLVVRYYKGRLSSLY